MFVLIVRTMIFLYLLVIMLIVADGVVQFRHVHTEEMEYKYFLRTTKRRMKKFIRSKYAMYGLTSIDISLHRKRSHQTIKPLPSNGWNILVASRWSPAGYMVTFKLCFVNNMEPAEVARLVHDGITYMRLGNLFTLALLKYTTWKVGCGKYLVYVPYAWASWEHESRNWIVQLTCNKCSFGVLNCDTQVSVIFTIVTSGVKLFTRKLFVLCCQMYEDSEQSQHWYWKSRVECNQIGRNS